LLKLDRQADIDEVLVEYARERSQSLIGSALEEEEMRAYAARRIRDDQELQEALGHVPGLAERVAATIEERPQEP
jgi:hypothetical protein